LGHGIKTTPWYVTEVRILAIETTSRRGSVALVDGNEVVSTRVHADSSSHGEVMLPLVGELFAEAGWARTALDRVAVGTGPGSFTGIRVGLALAKGIGLGLDRPVLGVGSLRAMCRGVPADVVGARCAVLDGRRDELFFGVYGERGAELAEPRIMPRSRWSETAPTAATFLGEVLAELGDPRVQRSELTDLPHAVGVAFAANELGENDAPAEPCYLRPVDAIPSGLGSPVSSKQAR
jgi:tRNA threonylcarbamoyladenosine biosynthesis protein TsaB